MTRKTLYRHMLAWAALASGLPAVYYWLLPTKCKRPFRWFPRNHWADAVLEILGNSVKCDYQRLADYYLEASARQLGDSIQVRMPARFVLP